MKEGGRSGDGERRGGGGRSFGGGGYKGGEKRSGGGFRGGENVKAVSEKNVKAVPIDIGMVVVKNATVNVQENREVLKAADLTAKNLSAAMAKRKKRSEKVDSSHTIF